MDLAHYSHAFGSAFTVDQLSEQVPAVFSDHAAECTGPKYVFISSRELVTALLDAGFVAMQARQARVRIRGQEAYARHMLRFKHPRESVTLVDAIPQIVLINSHDGRTSYQLRAGLYRPVCTNGLMTRIGDFGLIHVPHRGNVLRNVVDGALSMIRDFSRVGEVIEKMATLQLSSQQRIAFANDALRVRYANGQHIPIEAEQVLQPRRASDEGNDLWRTFNATQENLMCGNLVGRTVKGRATRSRAIRAIREDVRINNGLWQLALRLIGN